MENYRFTVDDMNSMLSRSVLVGIDRRLGGGNDIPGVQLLGHIHDGDAGDGVAVQDGPVDGGCATVFGQQRGMDVDGAKLGGRQNVLRQDAAIGRHHRQLRGQRADQLQRRTVPQLDGLVHCQAL